MTPHGLTNTLDSESIHGRMSLESVRKARCTPGERRGCSDWSEASSIGAVHPILASHRDAIFSTRFDCVTTVPYEKVVALLVLQIHA